MQIHFQSESLHRGWQQSWSMLKNNCLEKCSFTAVAEWVQTTDWQQNLVAWSMWYWFCKHTKCESCLITEAYARSQEAVEARQCVEGTGLLKRNHWEKFWWSLSYNGDPKYQNNGMDSKESFKPTAELTQERFCAELERQTSWASINLRCQKRSLDVCPGVF